MTKIQSGGVEGYKAAESFVFSFSSADAQTPALKQPAPAQAPKSRPEFQMNLCLVSEEMKMAESWLRQQSMSRTSACLHPSESQGPHYSAEPTITLIELVIKSLKILLLQKF